MLGMIVLFQHRKRIGFETRLVRVFTFMSLTLGRPTCSVILMARITGSTMNNGNNQYQRTAQKSKTALNARIAA